MTPWFITATVSAMVMASSWSCVTWMKVMPTSVWMRLSSSCIWRRSLRPRAPSGSAGRGHMGWVIRGGAGRLGEQEHLGVVDQGAGDGDALLLAAGELVRLLALVLAELHQVEHL